MKPSEKDPKSKPYYGAATVGAYPLQTVGMSGNYVIGMQKKHRTTPSTADRKDRVIEHLLKILKVKNLIVTGSYALRVYGLTDKVKDLDIILVNPEFESVELLHSLRVYSNPDYPDSHNYIRIEVFGEKVDIWFSSVPEKYLTIEGINYAMIKDIVKAKKSYKSVKQVLQLKKMSELFFYPSDLTQALTTISSTL